MGDAELIFDISVKVNNSTGEVEHALEKSFKGYTQDEINTIQQIIDEDVAYLLEDIRRRVLVIK